MSTIPAAVGQYRRMHTGPRVKVTAISWGGVCTIEDDEGTTFSAHCSTVETWEIWSSDEWAKCRDYARENGWIWREQLRRDE